MVRIRLPIVGLFLALLVASGCSLTPSMPTPEAEQSLPDQFTTAPSDTMLPAAAADTVRPPTTRWWTSFDDSTLTTLVDTAVAANFDLQSARARVAELAAQVRMARAPLFPSISANGEASSQTQPANTGIGGALRGGGGSSSADGDAASSTPDRLSFTTYQAGLGLSYELDFWGRVRSQRTAAVNQYQATTADLQTARISVISQTISTYAEIAALHRLVALGRHRIDVLEQRLALTEDRYARGLSSSFQLHTVQQSLETARSAQPERERQLYDAKSRLATLLGRFAGEQHSLLPDSLAIPNDSSAVPAGLPADLLFQRPDVRAAARRLEARRQEIGVARAELLPSLRLTGQGGTESSALSSLVDLDQHFARFAAQLTAPLFQGGRLRANVDAAEARYQQQAAQYQHTVLTAFQEVKASLVAYNTQRERARDVHRQLEAARNAYQTQHDRYRRGVGNITALLDAERTLVEARMRRAEIEQAVLNARLALHRALGGPWTDPETAETSLFSS